MVIELASLAKLAGEVSKELPKFAQKNFARVESNLIKLDKPLFEQRIASNAEINSATEKGKYSDVKKNNEKVASNTVKADLEEKGYHVIDLGGGRGVPDLIAVKDGKITIVEVKGYFDQDKVHASSTGIVDKPMADGTRRTELSPEDLKKNQDQTVKRLRSMGEDEIANQYNKMDFNDTSSYDTKVTFVTKEGALNISDKFRAVLNEHVPGVEISNIELNQKQIDIKNKGLK